MFVGCLVLEFPILGTAFLGSSHFILTEIQPPMCSQLKFLICSINVSIIYFCRADINGIYHHYTTQLQIFSLIELELLVDRFSSSGPLQ